MNILIAGSEQLFTQNKWANQLNVSIIHSANKMSKASVAQLSKDIDIKRLRAYRTAVARRTRTLVSKLQAAGFKHKVDPVRMQKVLNAGAVTPEAMEIIN